MQCVAIVNHKGGTGKTTTAVNLAVALAKKGKKVLAIDFDPQGSLSYYFGIERLRPSLADLFYGEATASQVIQTRENVDILPTDTRLADLELSMATARNREHLLEQVLLPIAEPYDYLLIDCAPSLSLLTVNALTAADKVLIPLQLEVLSLQGLHLILETIFNIKGSLNPSLKILGIVPVMVDKRRKVTQEIFQFIPEHFGLQVFQTPIPQDVKIVESPSFGMSIFGYAPKTTGADAYLALAEEFIEQTAN